MKHLGFKKIELVGNTPNGLHVLGYTTRLVSYKLPIKNYLNRIKTKGLKHSRVGAFKPKTQVP